jgi:hypothetical protein
LKNGFQFVTNAIQLWLYHHQLYTHQHATKVATTTKKLQVKNDMVANENSFRKGSLEVRE